MSRRLEADLDPRGIDADRTWDVVVVGAGPAGATAAIHLARRGHGVLLVDRAWFPRDKVCGDGLIPDALACLDRMGLGERVRERAHPLSCLSFSGPSRVRADIPGRFFTLKRLRLDHMLVQAAREAGASLLVDSVADVDGGAGDGGRRVLLERAGRSLRARVVLLATGARAEIASRLRLVRDPAPSGMAARCYVRSPVRLDRMLVSYDRLTLPGYAWLFPLGHGEYNVGCGVTHGRGRPRVNLRAVLAAFLRGFPEARTVFERADRITPLKGAMLRCGLDLGAAPGLEGVLAIGEAIATTFPFSGEGIGKAMASGELAALACDRALRRGELPGAAAFAADLLARLGPKYRDYRTAERWLRLPWFVDLACRRMNRSPAFRAGVAGILEEIVKPGDVFSPRGLLRSLVE